MIFYSSDTPLKECCLTLAPSSNLFISLTPYSMSKLNSFHKMQVGLANVLLLGGIGENEEMHGWRRH